MFSEIAFTIYAVTDIKKARAFYEGALGLVPNEDFPANQESQWIEYNVGPGTLAIGCSPEWKPSQDGASAALEAKDFNATITKLKAASVSFMMEPQEFPTCHMAVIEDPDKNRIVIHQRKTK